MKLYKPILKLCLLTLMLYSLNGYGQNKTFLDSALSNLKFRSIGPAFMSGRIADIAIHPKNENCWYVAVGSGGVWKTENSGTTWKPIFEKYGAYSTGCITIRKENPNEIWLGTGENVGGRHVGYGDGVYRSLDGGENWEKLGLEKSEHIAKIILHPNNNKVVWVASQGPLWSKGGDRGVYKTSDGGKTWKRTLGDQDWVGATDLLIDPRNPKRLYAATWERHRNVAAYIGGGPGSGVYRSDDGGENWKKLKAGLPTSDMGKIGLAMSPQKPDVIYAAIELDRRKGGVFRSENRGETWVKMSDAVAGATGPHYYQELYACPHNFDRIYLADSRMQISDDGGKTFRIMNEKHKHPDNHSLNFRKDDPEYLIVGTDGGIYESFDRGKNWRFIPNLPITQYYKVAVDDAEPFYNIYGGTQDNNTQGGPSRTDNYHGIRNSDWFITLYGDGHQPATEPGNPNIMYSESQEGNLYRVDRTTGEIVFIQPQPSKDEGFERYNWDAPIVVSPHSPSRLYFASHRVWKSNDRGDSWKAISDDLTKNQERMALPVNGKTWSWDAAWDVYAMSTYNTITSLTESPIKEGLLYAGTDDGIIQVSDNDGASWHKVTVGKLPGAPATAFVNNLVADLFDENTVYAILDNHKFGDYSPYVYKSTDQGRTWKSIVANLPKRNLTWRLVQDHVKPGLLFLATEFGIYTSLNGGKHWYELSGGIPTISFRDLAIQRRENDLIGASFGRGFYVLDDYSVLRELAGTTLTEKPKLYPSRKAWWYIQRAVLGFNEQGAQGAGYYTAPNPPFGAVFTYSLPESMKSLKEKRSEIEKKLEAQNKDLKFPGWKALEKEEREEPIEVFVGILNKEGKIIKKVNGPQNSGLHRVSWDLHLPSKGAIDINKLPESGLSPLIPPGNMVAPGKYRAVLFTAILGEVKPLSDTIVFDVEPLYKGVLTGSPPAKTAGFWNQRALLFKDFSNIKLKLQKAEKKLNAFRIALEHSNELNEDLYTDLFQIKQRLDALNIKLNGQLAKKSVGEKEKPLLIDRIKVVERGTRFSTYGPTPLHLQSFELARQELHIVALELNRLLETDFVRIERILLELGAPNIQ